MKNINPNIEILKSHLLTIKDKGKSYCITITTMGNLFYILNDGQGFYLLLVPNKKLTQQSSTELLKLNEWKEKFHLTNYHKTFDCLSIDIITSEIEIIFKNILKIPDTRKWRFEVNSGMMVVKANEISLDATSRRENNKLKANTPIRKFLKILFYPFSTNLRISIIVTIILGVIFIFKEKSKNNTIDYKLFILILGMGFFYYYILQLRWPDKKK